MTLTPTQRRFLKQHAHHLKPLVHMGKEGPTREFFIGLREQLEAHELIKVRVLNNCLFSDDQIREAIANEGITLVQKVGHIYTVFKQKVDDSWFELPKR